MQLGSAATLAPSAGAAFRKKGACMIRFLLMVVAWVCATSFPARAASLSVSPINLSVAAPGNQTRMTIRNETDRAITVQVRVFRWTLRNGRDYYETTQDVVVSPPISRLRGRADLQVRIVRTATGAIKGEQTYRVVVDEVPDANRVRNLGVNVALRYTLPLFFISPDASQPRLNFTVRGGGKRRLLVVTNSGDRHVRLSNVSIGKSRVHRGLAGYVLGHSTRTFDLPASAPSSGTITAITGQGKLNARISR
ncbi:MAG: molecular chaperone [Beijerinckiaceae bacterium]